MIDLQIKRETALVEPTRNRSFRNAQRAGGDGGFASAVVDEIGQSLSNALRAEVSDDWAETQPWFPMWKVLSPDIVGTEMIASLLDVEILGKKALEQVVLDRFVERLRISLAFLRAKVENETLFEEHTQLLRKRGAKWASRDKQVEFLEVTDTDLSVVEQDLLRRLGMVALEIAVRSGLLQKDKRDRCFHLSLTRSWRRRIARNLKDRALARPIRRPMVCRPKDWNEAGVGGGYLSDWMAYPLVDGDSLASPMVVAMANKMQATGYRINEKVLTLAQRGLEAYRSSVEEVDTKIHKAEATFKEANALLNDVFYYPVKCDYRGRVYYVSDILNPQGWDLDKGLLRFAEGCERTPQAMRWLKIHTANVFGQDKLSFEQRVAWCDERMDEMSADPVAFWKGNDPGDKSRWSALAAVLDLVGDGLITVPIQVDATCSGLQHLSAMAGDEVVATATNVIPSDDGCRRDPYITTAEACGRKRSEVKRPVMCIPYGISVSGMVDQLIEEGICSSRMEAQGLAETIWASCEELMSGVLGIMRFLKKAGKMLAEAGIRPSWTTPSGFTVVMPTAVLQRRISIMDAKGNMVKTQFGVEARDLVDTNQTVRGMAPNYVHSYDAALVALVVSRWDGPIVCIHDCFATTADRMDDLRALIYECFVELYGDDAILKARNEFVHSAPADVSIPLTPQRREMSLSATSLSEYMYS
tara:strand:+ start:3770 stop:5866 length:2097 start_codon:yes stop_codon:yes gene_type:complete